MKNHALKLGELDVLNLDVPYVAAPTELYAAVCKDRPHSLLLESAEIDSKQDLKSLMLIDAAVRIVCRGRTVELEAKTKNGSNVLDAVEASITAQGLVVEQTRKTDLLTLHFAQENRAQDEDARLREPSPFDALRLIQQAFRLDGLPSEALFIGGLFAYDLVAQFEPFPSVEQSNRCPDYLFYVAETLLIIDHQRRKAKLQGTQFGGAETTEAYFDLSRRLQNIKENCIHPTQMPDAQKLASCEMNMSVSDEEFCAAVDELKSYVVKGDVFQVVPSRKFTLPCPSPLNAYLKLKQGNPSPYMFYMQDADFTLFGASPESALKYGKDTNQVEIYPIAGTRPRGKNADGSINLDLDGRIELELRNDTKEKAEHMMLVDLARNDVARISEPGTRYVADLLQVDRYSHVMHLVSRVVGQLRNDLDALHAYQACMNMGTLTGAPKIRAMQLIRQFEQGRRGSYGGAVGYLTGHGDMDTCIVIRSAYVEDGVAQVQAGAGVVFDSIPQAEADETRSKAQAVITAIKAAHTEAQA
ncbi:anthranilate synthase component 1 [Enterovibrio nigricans]|uniref:Anthranilate synthase component 1 n=1 Tax=Enterovibrio nigricans DSM 22720 TaxID=1121868 RepID=A0A1T4UWT5_9GAMM|nr:anthranilate synthase component 1 [Enterovibrio nigricans]SKA57140.1 anthranilate synthase, component I [Enterovibrio nigricans DSM 22720]